MPEKIHSLITNTTSLIGYIAILMFVGAYIGGNDETGNMINEMTLKGNLVEYNNNQYLTPIPKKTVIITIDGRQYQAEIYEEIK